MGWFSKVKKFVKNNASAIAHGVLDVVGFIPVVGAVADVANAALYLAEGNYKEAALSALSAIPAVGEAIAIVSKSTKVVAKGSKIAKGVKTLKNLKKAKGANKAVSKFTKAKKVVKKALGKLEDGAKSVNKAK